MEQQQVALPKKRFFRQRAHANPFVDHDLEYPMKPSTMNWSSHYPEMLSPGAETSTKRVEFVDVGCGYGGLSFALAQSYPDKLVLGMEIRDQVTDYVAKKALALRSQNPGQYQNVSVIRANAMKFLPNFFEKAQLEKIFFLFPDPHFKKKKHKARIVTYQLLAEYAYVTKVGGLLYIATDVKDLFNWMVAHIDGFPLFERLSSEEENADPVVKLVLESTEEGMKVERTKGSKYFAVYKRIEDPAETSRGQ